MTTTESLTFESIESRDAYLDEHFPVRRATDQPGIFELEQGAWLSVRYLTIEWAAAGENPNDP
jgi:hypothetical protein